MPIIYRFCVDKSVKMENIHFLFKLSSFLIENLCCTCYNFDSFLTKS